MNNIFQRAIVLALPMSLNAAALAQTEAESLPQASEPADHLSVSLDMTITSQYFFRGIVQETDGFIAQPGAEIGIEFVENEDYSLSGYVGIWSSYHDQRTGSTQADTFTGLWYEFDYYAGLSLTTGRLTTDLVYTSYTSPNGAFSTVDELSVSLAFDDSGLWGESNYSLAPYATIAFEVGANGADGGANDGVFLAAGIEPSKSFSDTPFGEVALSFPIEAGFSLSDYYEVAGVDESFGYLSAGIAVSVPMSFIPDGYGDWNFHAGLDYLLLGDNTEIINAGEDSEWIFHAGVGVEF